ncbi:MAG: T9SS type A sorting domain-containing protein, partial [Bacteroidetes bacterium]|nr:T9SS type A sorting domain-containing protein [Bacteroidota bacterium]
ELQYRLRQHDYDGTVSYSFILDVRLSSTADSPELAAWPQPATDVLHLQLRVPAEHALQLRISDMLGREVRLHRLEAGTPHWSWDLTDAAGGRVPPGLYLVSVRAGDVRLTRKVVVR